MAHPTPPPEPARPRPIIPLLDYQRADIESHARFRWNCWARQTGKSFTKSLRRILRGLTRRRNQIFLSAGERQSRELMLKARQHCQALKIVADFHDRAWFRDLRIRQMEITLPGGVRVIGLPANPHTARGYTGDVLLDEFAMHAHDREIWASIFPSLLRGGGELDIASTPKGRGNLFYRLRENPRFSTSTVTLPQAVAAGLDADPEQMRQAMDDDLLFRQEFLCEFVDEATAFLTYDQIAACVDDHLSLADSPSSLFDDPRELFVGVDVGRKRDLTVLWVLARSPQPRIARSESDLHDTLATVALFELSAAPFRAQSALLSEILSIRRVRRCAIDAGGLGMQLAEDAADRFGRHRVETVTFTPGLKSQIAAGLRIAVENARIRIPADERIRNDWHSVERTVTAGGHFRLDAKRSEGSHADRFWAAALAVHAAALSTGPPEGAVSATTPFARDGAW
ncbi:MAG: terminase family protein [Phycisphaerae bacterium]|nr:terminase family protein [Phycisphaerae bacterium]